MQSSQNPVEKALSILSTEPDPLVSLGKALNVIRTATQVCRVYIFKMRRELDGILVVDYEFESCSDGVQSFVDNPEMKGVPIYPKFKRWADKFDLNEPVYGLIQEFPESERQLLEFQQIKSTLAVPINTYHGLCGFVGLDDTKTNRVWTADEIQMIKKFSTVLGLFMIRILEHQSLQSEQFRHGILIDESPVAIIETDSNLNILSWNRSAQETFGFTEEEAVGRCGDFLIAEQDRDYFRKCYSLLLESGKKEFKKVWKHTLEAYDKSGNHLLLEWRSRILLNHSGLIKSVISVARDITQIQKQQQELEERENLYRNLFETMSDGVVYQDSEGKITQANKAACEILGLTLDQMQGRTSSHPEWKAVTEAMELFPGDEHPAMVALRTGKPVFSTKMGVYHPEQNTYRWISINATPEFRNGEDKPFRVFTLFRDITSEFNLFSQLRRNRDLFLMFLDEIKVGIWLRNDKQELIYVNKALGEIFKISTKDFYEDASLRYLDYVHPNDRAEVLANHNLHLNSKKELQTEWRLIRSDGSQRYVHVRLINIQIPGDPENWYSVGFMTDLTDQKRVLEEMRQGRVAAEQLSNLRSNIISSISHEFRTPLTGILGFSTLLKGISPQGEHHEYLDMIEQSANRLHHILESILSYSILDSSRQELRPQEFDLELHLEEKLREFETNCKYRDLYFQWFFSEDSIVYTDKNIVTSIIDELLENAYKFTKNGGIRLNVDVRNRSIQIQVRDTGIGIPENANHFIFEPFRQSSEGHSRNNEGAGLGLAIVSKQIQLLGGNISHHPNELGGTVFKVTLPMMEAKANTSGSRKKVITSTRDINILYVDDNSVLTSMVAKFLSGYKIQTAKSYEEGLSMAKYTLFDIILLDINLREEKDGHALCKEIRKLEWYTKVPIFAVTAYSLDQIENYMGAGGFDQYIGKPFTGEELKNRINGRFGLNA
jgi:PAS domain S-box-containing protein